MSDELDPSNPTRPMAPVAPPKLHISASDLQGVDVENRVQEMRSAAAPQLVREVGQQPSQGLGVMGMILSMALAGLVGGFLGWVAGELLSQQWMIENTMMDWESSFEPWYGWSATWSSILFLGGFGLVLGAVIAGWDAAYNGTLSKLGPRLALSMLYIVPVAVGGSWVANKVFEELGKSATGLSDLHFPRGVAWAVFGALLGLAIGASTKVVQRALQGAAGGLVGGFIGGFVFDFIQLGDQTNGILNRIIGLTITGVAIAVSISLIEVATRQHWLEIVSGGMAGKQFILYHDRTTVGSSPTCDVTLIKDPSMAPQHLQLVRQGQSLEARPVDPGFIVSVNGSPISRHQLNDSDLVQIGSTVLRYRSKQQKMPTGMPLPSHAPVGAPPAGMPPPGVSAPTGGLGTAPPQPPGGAYPPPPEGPTVSRPPSPGMPGPGTPPRPPMR